MSTLPPLFATGGISQVLINTAPSFTEFAGTAVNISQIAVPKLVSVRAQLFPNGTTPAGVATKVIQH